MSVPFRSLTKKKDFDAVFKAGRPVYDRLFGVRKVKNDLGHNRFGIMISTKVSKKAVVRNKIRRRIREALKKNTTGNDQGFDVIINVLKEAAESSYADIETVVIRLFGNKQ